MEITFSRRIVSYNEVKIDLDAVLESLDTQEDEDAANGVKVTGLALTDWDELQIDFEMGGVNFTATFTEPHLGGNSPEITCPSNARPQEYEKIASVIPYLEAVRAACDI